MHNNKESKSLLDAVTKAHQIAKYHQQMANTYEQQGDFEKALIHYKQFHTAELRAKEQWNQSLQEDLEFYQILLDAVPVPIFYKDKEGLYLGCNAAFSKMFGVSRQELIGKTVYYIVSDEMGDMYRQKDLELLHNPGVQIYEGVVQVSESEFSNIIAHKATLLDGQGEVSGIVGVILDITSRKQAEQQLEQFKQTLDQTLDCVFMFGDDLKFFYANQGAVTQIEYSLAELMEMTPVDIKPDFDEAQFRALIAPLRDGSQTALTFETIHQAKSGKTIPVEVILQYIKPANSEQKHFISIVRDITERKQAELALHQANVKLRRRVKELSTLNHLAQLMSTVTDLPTLLNQITEQLVHIFEAHGAVVGLLDGNENILTITAHYSLYSHSRSLVGQKFILDSERSFSRRLFETGQSFILAGSELDSFPNSPIHELMKRLQIKGLMFLPLWAQGKIIGFISISITDPDRQFTTEELMLAETIAGQVAGTIEKAHLLEEEHRLRRLAERRVEELATLNYIAQTVVSSTDLNQALDVISQQITYLFGVYNCSLALFDEEQTDLTIVTDYIQDRGSSDLVGYSIPLQADTYVTQILEEERTILFTDLQHGFGKGTLYRTYQKRRIQSLIVVPLLAPRRFIGTMTLADNGIGREFTRDEITLAETVAGQVAGMIENNSLFEEELHHRLMAEGLREVTTILTSSLDQKTVLDKILDLLGQVIQYESAVIFLAQDDDLIVMEGTERIKPYIGRRVSSITTDASILSVFKQQKPLTNADLSEIQQDWEVLEGIQSWMCVPLLAGDEAIGVLSVYCFDIGVYSEEDVQLLQIFAHQAAIAIENARLFEAVHKAWEQSETLYSASLALSASVDLSQVLNTILTELRQVVPYDSASVHELKGDYMEIIGGTGFDNLSVLIGLRCNVHFSELNRQLMQTREPIILEDASQHPEFQQKPHSELGIRGWLSVPLLFGDEIIGKISIDKKEAGFYTEEHSRLAMAFATQAAIAIKNAQLFEAERIAKKSLAQTLQDLKKTQTQLVHQEKMASLGMLTAGIAHEIKNPLNFVNSFAKLSLDISKELQQIIQEQTLPPEVQKRIESILTDLQFNMKAIDEEGERADKIVQSMLHHSRYGASEPQKMDVNLLLGEAVNLAFHGIWAKDFDFGIEIDTSYDPFLEPLIVVPQELSRVFVNLINNAYDATLRKKALIGEGYQARLKIETKNMKKEVQISVRDNGLGIEPEIQDRIFEPFFTTKSTGEGTGLGLSISYDIIVQGHQGKISVDSEVGHYTQFTISLPK